MSLRTERIAEQLRAEIARVLHQELTDPRVGLVTLTRVDVSPDLCNAIVFWSPLESEGGADPETIGEGLASAAGFIRRRVAGALSLRRMPELRFRHDPSLDGGARMLQLLRELEQERDSASERDEGEHGE